MGALLYTTKELAYGEHTIKLVGTSQALGISKIWYADGSGIFSMKQKKNVICCMAEHMMLKLHVLQVHMEKLLLDIQHSQQGGRTRSKLYQPDRNRNV